MKEPIEFSDRERFVLSYYRDAHLSSWSRYAVLDGTYLGVSVVFMALYLAQQDVAWGVVGYGILVWRVVRGMVQSRGFTEDFRSILRKYDAKVREGVEQTAGSEEQK